MFSRFPLIIVVLILYINFEFAKFRVDSKTHLIGSSECKNTGFEIIINHQHLLANFVDSILKGPGSPYEKYAPLRNIEYFDTFRCGTDRETPIGLVFRDTSREVKFNVEIQQNEIPGFVQRLHYFAARMYTRRVSLLGRGEERYSRLEPVIVIAITNFSTPFFGQNFISYIHNDHFNHTNFVGLQLPNFKKNINKLKGPLDEWIYFLNNARTECPPEMSELRERNEHLKDVCEYLYRAHTDKKHEEADETERWEVTEEDETRQEK